MARQLVVVLTNGSATVRAALRGQTTKSYFVQVLDPDGVEMELALDRTQWEIKSIEPSYKNIDR